MKPDYIKLITDKLAQRKKLPEAFREELVDHYATLFEQLNSIDNAKEKMEYVLQKIDSDITHFKTKNTKTMLTKTAILLPLALISVLLFNYNYSASNSNNTNFDENCQHHLVYLDPPYGNPLLTMNISSGFGEMVHPIKRIKKMHQGIDLIAPLGTPVYSVEKGKVTKAGYDDKLGYYIEIQHDDIYSSRFHHLKCIKVEEGQLIEAQTEIGEVGNTGLSTAPHLHYEVIKNGEKIDPIDYLQV